MPSPTSLAIATQVLVKARIVDTRMRLGTTETESDAQIMAWAEIFDGEPVWPKEALDAVAAHYKKSNAFPIMPGDVVDYCKRQPVTSSREHIEWVIDLHVNHPWSQTIQTLVGRPIPQLEPDTDDVDDKPRLVEKRRAFINEYRGYIVDQIMANTGQKEIAA